MVKERLNIFMLSAEATPYAKVGGLADVAGVLPRVLEKLGARVTLVLPAYKAVDLDRNGVRRQGALSGFAVPIGSKSVAVEVYQARMPQTEVDVYLVGGGGYFSRDGIYDDPATREAFPDSMQRFLFLMKAGLELLRRIEADPPDVIHCHDSHTAMVPGLLQTVYREEPFFAHAGTLLTIHNLAYQGIFPPDALAYAGMDRALFYPGSPYEYWGKVNFLKAGIATADLLNTVSETYAREIQSDREYGYGLEGVLRLRSSDLSGIVNGIDYGEWNPETDTLIPARYSAADLSGKSRCKSELLRAFGLPPASERTPLLGMVSRLADQKGFDLIGEAIEEIARLELQLVILGTGQQKYHELLQDISNRFGGKIAVRFEFNNALAHLIEAGADMFLMPSRYEPCGLNQLFSLRYGTVPVVRETGGLSDTVSNYDIAADSGTGFSFREYSSAQMMIAIKRALMVYADPVTWQGIMRRGMAQDWSWEGSAARYIRLYRRICEKKAG